VLFRREQDRLPVNRAAGASAPSRPACPRVAWPAPQTDIRGRWLTWYLYPRRRRRWTPPFRGRRVVVRHRPRV